MTYKESWGIMKKNWLLVSIPVVLDLATIYLLSLAAQFFALFVEVPLTELLFFLLKGEGQNPFADLVMYYLVFYLIVFIILVITQYLSWDRVFRFSKARLDAQKFIMKTVYWMILFMVVNTLNEIVLVINSILLLEANVQAAFNILYGILGYLFLVSYSSSRCFTDSLKLGLKKAKVIIPGYLITLITLSAAYYLTVIFHNVYAAWILGLFVFLPVVTWARIFMILKLKEVE